MSHKLIFHNSPVDECVTFPSTKQSCIFSPNEIHRGYYIGILHLCAPPGSGQTVCLIESHVSASSSNTLSVLYAIVCLLYIPSVTEPVFQLILSQCNMNFKNDQIVSNIYIGVFFVRLQSQPLSLCSGTPELYVDQQQITGVVGGSVTVLCYYSSQGSTGGWCRMGGSCVAVGYYGALDGTFVKLVQEQRETTNGYVLMVNMSGLMMKNTGWYRCEKGKLHMPVHITVNQPTTTQSTTASEYIKPSMIPFLFIQYCQRSRNIERPFLKQSGNLLTMHSLEFIRSFMLNIIKKMDSLNQIQMRVTHQLRKPGSDQFQSTSQLPDFIHLNINDIPVSLVLIYHFCLSQQHKLHPLTKRH